ncbi:FHA domain-containing protein [Mycobacterium sp. URHB0021]
MKASDDQRSDGGGIHETSAFPFDLDDEFESPTGAVEDDSWAEGLPGGAALLVVDRGRNAGARFLLNEPVTTAGRLPGSDIFLDDITVSRRHAEFRMEHGQHRVVDTGSLNKTYVNRRPVESAILANGDQIQIGRFRLVFLNAAQRVDAMPP